MGTYRDEFKKHLIGIRGEGQMKREALFLIMEARDLLTTKTPDEGSLRAFFEVSQNFIEIYGGGYASISSEGAGRLLSANSGRSESEEDHEGKSEEAGEAPQRS